MALGRPAAYTLDFDANHYGWVAGVGAEYKIAKSVRIKGEVLYSDYGKEQYASSGGGQTHSIDLTTTTVRIASPWPSDL